MEPWIQYVLTAGGALITLLLIVIAWFLREIHTDFKEMRHEIEKLNVWTAVKDTLFTLLDNRVKALEGKVFRGKKTT